MNRVIVKRQSSSGLDDDFGKTLVVGLSIVVGVAGLFGFLNYLGF